MAKASGAILKSCDVNFEGHICIDVTPGAAPQPRPAGAPLITPQAQVVENQPDFAVIEITCSCGTKLRLKCDYPDTAPTTN